MQHALTSKRKSSTDAGSGNDGGSEVVRLENARCRGKSVSSSFGEPHEVVGTSRSDNLDIGSDHDASGVERSQIYCLRKHSTDRPCHPQYLREYAQPPRTLWTLGYSLCDGWRFPSSSLRHLENAGWERPYPAIEDTDPCAELSVKAIIKIRPKGLTYLQGRLQGSEVAKYKVYSCRCFAL